MAPDDPIPLNCTRAAGTNALIGGKYLVAVEPRRSPAMAKRDDLNSIIGRLEDARTTAEEARDSTAMERKDEALKEIRKTLTDVIDDLELRVGTKIK